MVGVGPEGAESVLARVSLVNFHGAVQLDEFVRPRERVVDYRTEFSGVRAGDMVNAKPFPAVQSLVAALIKDRVLIGHAVHNDLKALLLSHPHTATRDTQYYAGKSGVVKSKRIALRKLVQQELGATIQGGEHSSVSCSSIILQSRTDDPTGNRRAGDDGGVPPAPQGVGEERASYVCHGVQQK